MAKHVRRKGIRPQLVLCSSARRARETLDGVGLEAGEVRIEDELYGASAPELLRRLREVPDTVESVLLVGHNPAMQELAITVAGGGALLGEVERKFPTGALATLELAGDWGAIGPGRAELVAFVRPRELG
jgi:phosphohistidine phosphatase